ncbi:hypothetical protein [Natrarchaeobaculum aegyptiacum]|uniref:Beta-ketoadipyl CoA thiolase n=1 Tax=Natrarchaeobaculum aegyptiacum TaxID=745377 RepID=A0A2Z2HT45_9EURY|nr:hypothetical protein [Natrarchaeobaculum aegyptiacum]ARS90322.1 hypothetical protein B1756_11700 [Natrarchaeobaculum aegyptiacum]
MSTELVAIGFGTIAVAIALLVGARHLYPRLELPPEALGTIRLLTATIAALLLLTGIGLVVVGLAG